MTESNNFLDMDSILDATLDDLDDVPEFKPFPAGTHQAVLTLVPKEIKKRPAIEWKLVAKETIELANPDTDKPVQPNDSCSGAFIFVNEDGTKNEMAQGQFKALLAPLSAHFGTATNRDTLNAANGCEVAVTMSQRAGKKGSSSEGKFFPVIEAIAVL